MCDNSVCQNPAVSITIGHVAVTREMPQFRRILRWLLIAILAALISYVSFRGYLSPELLMNFANSFTC